jgi:hypothetical protein
VLSLAKRVHWPEITRYLPQPLSFLDFYPCTVGTSDLTWLDIQQRGEPWRWLPAISRHPFPCTRYRSQVGGSSRIRFDRGQFKVIEVEERGLAIETPGAKMRRLYLVQYYADPAGCDRGAPRRDGEV